MNVTDAWQVEAEEISLGVTDHVFELVDCVDVPAELAAHVQAADTDPERSAVFDEWMAYLSEHDLLLPVEQSCDSQGLLLPWDMRGVRLQTVPLATLSRLHMFFAKCPRHTRALIVHYVFWLVRFERVQRRGTAEWTVNDVVFPKSEVPAFFKPSRLTLRNSAR
ncbi:MAG: hypothetical protein ABL916_22065 [Burkholderiaceae bacterium]